MKLYDIPSRLYGRGALSAWPSRLVLFFGVMGLEHELAAQTLLNPPPNIMCERLSPEDQGDNRTVITCFLQDAQGYIWFGTEAGVARYDGYAVKVYRHEFGNPSSIVDARVHSLWEDREGSIWVGTWRGLDRFDRTTGTFSHFVPDPQAPTGDWSNFITDLYEDKNGTLWVGGEGLRSFDRSTGSFTYFRDPDSLNRELFRWNAHGMYEDRSGDLWVGSATALGKLDRSKGSFTTYWVDEEFKKGASPDWYGFHWIQKIFEDRSGILWLCTHGGPVAFNRKNGTFKPYHIFPSLPESSDAHSVSSIVEDDAGGLWIGTWGGGVLKYNASEDKFEPFSLGSINASNVVSTLYKDRAGTIWIGTFEDAVLKVMNPSHGHERNRYVPPIAITSFKKINEPVSFGEVPGKQKPIELSFEENTFTIEFVALNYIHSEDNQYAYMLEGYDAKWNYCGQRRYAHYVDIGPGNYTFRAKGSNNDGVWNEDGATLAILVMPPWWRTSWFSVLFGATVISLATGGAWFYGRRRSMQRLAELHREYALARERTRISQDMHDEVGSALSEIAILTELAKKRPDQAQMRAGEISERTTELIDSMSEIVWATNPKNDTLDNLVSHIRLYAIKYLDLSRIFCDYVAPETIPACPMPPDVRRNVFLIVKEALHNIVKHAAASRVRINVETGRETLKILIQDNGKGFVPADNMDAGNGLGNMKRRMADVGGILEIESQPGRGTTVILVVRL